MAISTVQYEETKALVCGTGLDFRLLQHHISSLIPSSETNITFVFDMKTGKVIASSKPRVVHVRIGYSIGMMLKSQIKSLFIVYKVFGMK